MNKDETSSIRIENKLVEQIKEYAKTQRFQPDIKQVVTVAIKEFLANQQQCTPADMSCLTATEDAAPVVRPSQKRKENKDKKVKIA